MLLRTKFEVLTSLVLTLGQCLTVAVRGAEPEAHHPAPANAPVHPPTGATTNAPVKAQPAENELSNIGKSKSENLRFQEATEYEQQQNVQGAKKVMRAMQLRGGNTEQLEAAKLLSEVIKSDTSRAIKQDVIRAALMSLAEMAEKNGQLAQAQQVWSEYIERYPDDENVPEIILRQAYLYQRMGAYETAINRLYVVGKAALNPRMKISNLAYLKRVTLTMSSEIADTYFMWGDHYDEAAKHYDALLKQKDPELNDEVVNVKLIRSLARAASNDSSKNDTVIRRGIEFLKDHGESDYQVEVRYLVASAYKALNQKQEALNQLMQLLLMMDTADEKKAAKWKTWKMQAGNEIGNQLYLEGGTGIASALQIYQGLVLLDDTPEWKLPTHYQIGLCYERLSQPTRAIDAYTEILKFSELFSADALSDVVKLISKLSSAGTNAVSTFVWDQIPSAIRTQLQDPEVALDRKKAALIETLNGILQKPDLYDATRFSGITLPPETAALKSKNPAGADLVRLNRMLLEDAYATEIAKKQKTSAKLEPSLQLVVDMARFRKDMLSWKLSLDNAQKPPVEPKVTQK